MARVELRGTVWGLALLMACSRSDATPAAGAARAHPNVPAELATATGFDLAPALGGAVLAWAPPHVGQVHTVHFDADGRASEPGADAGTRAEGVSDAVVARRFPSVTGVGDAPRDLTLVDGATGLAMAWSETSGGGRLRAAWVTPGAAARTFELGPAWPGEVSSRGTLALGARAGGALLLARGLEAPCESDAAACSAFQFFQISAEGARATGLTLAVPSPCAAWSAQLVAAPAGSAVGPGIVPGDPPSRLDYAICSSAHAATTLTIFSIQQSPAYAVAEEVFAGCTPLGAGRFGGDAAFFAACGQDRRVATLPAGGGAPVVRNINERGLVCNARGARLRFGSDWLLPSEPLGRLELLLNDDLTPPGARAVWTGAALLVARSEEGRLRLSRYACRGSTLMELEGPFDGGS